MPLQNPPSDSYNRSDILAKNRIATANKKEFGKIISKVRQELGAEYTVQAETLGYYGDYTRLIISGRGNTGQKALVIDVRAGASSPVSEPAIFVRMRGSTDSSSEAVVGAAITPDRKIDGSYTLNSPSTMLARIINAAFDLNEHQKQEGYMQHGRNIIEDFRAIASSTTGSIEKAKRRRGIGGGSRILSSIPTQGEQLSASEQISVALQPGKREIDEIKKIQKLMSDRNLGYFVGDKFYAVGTGYVMKRAKTGEWRFERHAEEEVVKTSSGGEVVRAFVRKGLKEGATDEESIEGLLKYQKGRTTHQQSRPILAVPLVQEGNKVKVATPQNYQNVDPSRFGLHMASGDAAPYIESGVVYPGQKVQSGMISALTLHTVMPTYSGGILIDPKILEGFSGFGIAGGVRQKELGIISPQDIDTELGANLGEIFNFNKNNIGRTVKAGSRRGIGLGYVKVGEHSIDLRVRSKDYNKHITGMKIIIPPYMTKDESKFLAYDDKSSPGGAIKTDVLAQRLRKELGKYGVTVEQSGTDQVLFEVQTLNEVSTGAKNAESAKAGYIDPGGPISINIGGSKINLGAITGDTKQIVGTMVGAWAMQPLENKIKMLDMVEKGLGTWYGETYKGEVTQDMLDMIGMKYQELANKQGYHYYYPFGEMLRKFIELPTEKARKEAFERFGIYAVAEGSEVKSGRIGADMKKLLEDTAKAEGTSLGELGIRITRTKTSGVYNYSFMAKGKLSIIMPTELGMAPEFPGESREVNSDVVMAIASNFPQYAKEMGLLPESGRENEFGSGDREGWRALARAYAYNTALMDGDLYIPKDAKVVGKELAEKILSSGKLEEASGLTEKEMMDYLSDALGPSILHFKTSRRFLPSARNVESIDMYKQTLKGVESQARYSSMYLNAVRRLLESEAYGSVDPSLLGAHTSFIGSPDSRVGKDLGGKRVLRHIFGKAVPGSLSGHYQASGLLGDNEMYLPRGEVERLGRRLGLDGKEEMDKFFEYIETGDTSSAFWRYPTIDIKEGVAKVKIIGETEMRRRMGADPNRMRAISAGMIYLGMGVLEKFIGDLDLDPGAFIAGFLPKFEYYRDDRNILRRKLVGFDNALSKDPNYRRAKTRPLSDIAKVVGEDQAATYSISRKTMRDYMEQGEDWKGGVFKTLYQYGPVKDELLKQSGEMMANISIRRGTSHIALSQMMAMFAAAGIPSDIAEQMLGSASLYQETLEWTKQAATSTPLEYIAKTISFHTKATEAAPDLKQWSELKLILSGAYKHNADKDAPQWEQLMDMANPEEARRLVSRLLNMSAWNISSMEELSNETIAAGFAGLDNYRENYEKLLNLMRGKKGAERGTAITEAGGVTEGILSSDSPFAILQLSLAARRATRKAVTGTSADAAAVSGLIDDAKRGASLPYGGNMYTIEEYQNLPIPRVMLDLISMRTGQFKEPRSSRIPSVNKIIETYSAMSDATKNTPLGRLYGGLYAMMRTEGATKQTGLLPSGITQEQLQNLIKYGPESMHASGIAQILSKTHVDTTMATIAIDYASKYLYGPKYKEEVNLRFGKDVEELFKEGNIFEYAIAGSKKVNEGFWLIPRGYDEERMSAKFGKEKERTITGLPDFLRIVHTDQGPELHIMEAKLTIGSEQQARIQANLYREMMKRMYNNDRAGMERVLKSWRTSAEKMYDEFGIKPDIGETFVEDALEAIKNDRISTFFIGKEKRADIRPQVTEGKYYKSIDEKMTRSQWDEAIDKAAKEIGARLPKSLQRISDLVTSATGRMKLGDGSELIVDRPTDTHRLMQFARAAMKLIPMSKWGNTFMYSPDDDNPGGAPTSRRGQMEAGKRMAKQFDEEQGSSGDPTPTSTISEGEGIRTSSERTAVTIHLAQGENAVILSDQQLRAFTDFQSSGSKGAPKYQNSRPMPGAASTIRQERIAKISIGQTAFENLTASSSAFLSGIQAIQARTGIGSEIQGFQDIPDFLKNIAMQGRQSELAPVQRLAAQMSVSRRRIETALKAMAPLSDERLQDLLGADRASEARRMQAEYESEAKFDMIAGTRVERVPPAEIGEMAGRVTDSAGYGMPPKGIGKKFAGLTQESAAGVFESATKSIQGLDVASQEYKKTVEENRKVWGSHSMALEKSAKTVTEAGKAMEFTGSLLSNQIQSLEKELSPYSIRDGRLYRRTDVGGGKYEDQAVGQPEAADVAEKATSLLGLKQKQAAALIDQEPGSMHKLGSALRGIFGGFGFFYMQRVLGSGLEALQQGSKEYEQYRGIQAATAARFFDASAIQRSTIAGRRLNQLTIAGGSLAGPLAELGNKFIGTDAGDMWQAARVGGGVGLAGMFLAGEMYPVIGAAAASAATGLAAAAIPLTAVGVMALQQAEYARNPEAARLRAIQNRYKNIQRIAAGGYQTRAVNLLGEETTPGFARMFGTTEIYKATPTTTDEAYARSAGQWGLPMLQTYFRGEAGQEDLARTEEAMRRGYRYTSGKEPHRNYTPEEIEDVIDYAIATANQGGEFGGLSQEAIATGITTAASAGKGKDIALKVAQLTDAGADLSKYYELVSQITGQPISVQFRGDIAENMTTNLDKLSEQMKGMNIMTQISPELYRQALGRELTPEEVSAQAEQYVQYARQPWMQIAGMQGGIAERAAVTGVEAGVEYFTPDELAAMDSTRRRKVYEEGSYVQALQQKYQGYLDQGYSSVMALRVRTGVERLRDIYGDQGVAAGPVFESLNQQLVGMGMLGGQAADLAYKAAAEVATGRPALSNIITGVAQGKPESFLMGQVYSNLQAAGMPMTVQNMQTQIKAISASGGLFVGGQRMPIDVDQYGNITGAAPFTSTMSTADLQSIQARGGLGGIGREDQYKWLTSGVQGGGYTPTSVGARNTTYYGLQAVQMRMAQEQYDAQIQSIGIQLAGVALNRQYLLGGGEYGRGMFAIQDEQRALAHKQQMWGFSSQRQQMAMNWRQTQESWALQQRGVQMQRGFQREEWDISDAERAQRWQWKQEDFGEEVRFMTGRQRRLAERSMKRETIAHTQDEERIDRQKKQQEELWKLEDERFELEKAQAQETRQFQREQLRRSIEFYKKNKQLEDEAWELNKKHQIDMLNLQAAAAGAQLKHAKAMAELQRDAEDITKNQKTVTDEWGLMIGYASVTNEVIKIMFQTIIDAAIEVRNILVGETGNKATGGFIPAGGTVWVGERGPELFTAITSGIVTPHGTSTTPYNPWASSVVSYGQPAATGGPTTIVINIGNQKLGEFVISTVQNALEV